MISTDESTTSAANLSRLMAPPKNYQLQALILDRCRLMDDISGGRVGLTAAALHRWLQGSGAASKTYMTVYKYCVEMEAAGLLGKIAGTSEYLPTKRGREALAVSLALLAQNEES